MLKGQEEIPRRFLLAKARRRLPRDDRFDVRCLVCLGMQMRRSSLRLLETKGCELNTIRYMTSIDRNNTKLLNSFCVIPRQAKRRGISFLNAAPARLLIIYLFLIDKLILIGLQDKLLAMVTIYNLDQIFQ